MSDMPALDFNSLLSPQQHEWLLDECDEIADQFLRDPSLGVLIQKTEILTTDGRLAKLARTTLYYEGRMSGNSIDFQLFRPDTMLRTATGSNNESQPRVFDGTLWHLNANTVDRAFIRGQWGAQLVVPASGIYTIHIIDMHSNNRKPYDMDTELNEGIEIKQNHEPITDDASQINKVTKLYDPDALDTIDRLYVLDVQSLLASA